MNGNNNKLIYTGLQCVAPLKSVSSMKQYKLCKTKTNDITVTVKICIKNE